jgi:RHS repeat-associated protein
MTAHLLGSVPAASRVRSPRRSAFEGRWPQRVARYFAAVGSLALSALAQAQTPVDPYSYVRTSAFTYQANGLLASETIEPDQAQLCVSTTYTYDAYGNKTSATTTGCTGASGLALIDARTSGSTYAAQSGTLNGINLAAPLGTFATSALNALNHSEARTYDPRFGAMVSLTGPNALTTQWTLDDFGRKVLEVRADGTRTAMHHCWLAVSFNGVVISTASNSPGCPTPGTGEVPTDAVRFEHSVLQNAAGSAIGPFARVYYDRAGRKIRSVSEAFDGVAQPGGANRLIAQDSDHNAYGAAFLTTQPYFLDTGSSTTTGAANAGLTLTEYDALGRPTASYTTDPATAQQSGGSVASKTFGSRGSWRAALTTITYSGLITLSTDDKGRTRKEEKNPEGKTVRVTDASGTDAHSGAQLVHQHDAFGNLVLTKDALGNLITIAYDIRGRKVSLNDPDAGVTAYCYDALGQLKAQQTSNQRASHTPGTCPANSGLGTTAPAVANWTTLAYDKLGRLTSRAEPEYTSSWTYDACTKGVGKLCQTATSHGITKKLVYDNLGRPINSRTDVASGPSLATALSYDANGRVATQRYPTGVQLSYQYTARGFLSTVKLDTTATVAPLPATPGGTPAAGTTLTAGTTLWSAVAVNAWGKAEQSTYANGINNRAVFDAQSGRLTNLTAGPSTTSTVVDQRYAWDSVNLLTQRIDAIGDASGTQVLDTFQYDKLGRLTQYQVSGNASPASRTVMLQYNALGLLLAKSDVGNYSYPAQGVVNGRPHAVQSIVGIGAYSYDLNGNAITAGAGKWRSLAYTSFNLPDGTNGIAGASGTPRATWQYDENHQRIREDRVNASGTRTTWSLHPDNQGGLGFEREIAPGGSASNRHYLSAGGSAFAVIVTTGSLPTLQASDTAPALLASVTAVKLEFWHKDQLGSLIATTDHAGAVTARYAYDPFGKRRYTNSSYDAFGTLVVDWTTDTNNGNDRGFTGHEHLDELGLVHMNGRIFDPNTGRFLQADPFIQDLMNLQNFDRYTYCFNSPLVCTDPSGYFSLKQLVRVAAAIAAAYFTAGLVQTWMIAGATSGLMAGGGLSTAFVTIGGEAAMFSGLGSAASAAVGGFASGAIASGSIKGALQGALSGGLFAGVGQVVGDAGLGATGSVINAERFAGAIALHGVAGCVSSIAGGAKCGPGALSAAFSKAALPATAKFDQGLERAFAHSVVGGTASVLGGGKFANGALTGAFSYLFNECMQTRMCGSDSTSVRVTGNRALGNLAHAEIEISSGYDFVVLEAGPSSTNRLDSVNGMFDRGPNWGSAFSYDLIPPLGETAASIGLKLQNSAGLYNNDLRYAIPGGSGSAGRVMDYGYNSNSYVGGLLEHALPGSGIRWGVQEAARIRGFRVPGMEKPIPLGGPR